MTNEEKLLTVNAYTKMRGIRMTFSFGSPVPSYQRLYYNIMPDWKSTAFDNHAYVNPEWASKCSMTDLLEQVRIYISVINKNESTNT